MAPQQRQTLVASERADITVAIASRNRRESLRRALRSLADQDVGPERLEVVVVLDGSEDDSAEMLRGLELPLEIRVVEQERCGLASARNRGAAAASSPVVLFCDDDLVAAPALVREHAEGHGITAADHVIFGSYRPAIEAGTLWAKLLRIWWEDHFTRKGRPDHRWTYADFLDGNCSMPRALLERFGGFHEGFDGGRRQDWDLGLRMLAADVVFEYRPQAAAEHRFDTAFATALRNSCDEGRQDVLLARRHPVLVPRLRLARVGRYLVVEAPPLMAMIERLRRPHGRRWLIAQLSAFERAGLRGRWRRLTDLALDSAYATGMLERVADGELDWLVAGGAASTIELHLDEPSDFHLADDVVGSELDVLWRDQRLAQEPLVRSGEQWDAVELIDRILTSAVTPALRGDPIASAQTPRLRSRRFARESGAEALTGASQV
jgi:hypothetical protein